MNCLVFSAFDIFAELMQRYKNIPIGIFLF